MKILPKDGKIIKVELKDGKKPVDQLIEMVKEEGSKIPIKVPFAASGFKHSKEPTLPNPIIMENLDSKPLATVVEKPIEEIKVKTEPKKEVKEIKKQVKKPKK